MHHVGAFDNEIGRGECDLMRARRFDCQERDVPGARAGTFEPVDGRVVGDELDRDTEPLAKLAREIKR